MICYFEPDTSYSATNCIILSSLNVINRFTLEQRWNLLSQLQYDAKKIIFSDEAHFHLDGYGNKHNLQKPMDPLLVFNCLKRLMERRHHRLIFFWKWGRQNLYGLCRHLTQPMITGFFFAPDLHCTVVNDVWFQQYGVTFHTSHVTIDLLRQTFDGRSISWNGNVSCYLTLLNYFLGGLVKDKY